MAGTYPGSSNLVQSAAIILERAAAVSSLDRSPFMNSIIPFGSNPSTMSSREVAELTGKRHDHVLRDIRTMIERLSTTPDLGWYCESERVHPRVRGKHG